MTENPYAASEKSPEGEGQNDELGPDELGHDELGSGELGSGELGSGELGSGELGSGELGSGELGSGELGSGELGSGELGSGELGSGELGSGELGPGELGHDELGAGEVAYNVVTDTVTGLNLRGSDNKFQAKFTAISTALLAVVGALAVFLNPRWNLPWFAGALVGGFCGIVIGIFLSGIFLMVFRGLRHLRGKHN